MNTELPIIQLVNYFRKGQKHIGLKFKYNEDLLHIIRDIPYARWSKTQRLWYLPYSDYNLNVIKTCFKDKRGCFIALETNLILALCVKTSSMCTIPFNITCLTH